MPLIKVSSGLLEEDNFYLTSPAADFLTDGSWSRDEEKFRLKSGTVKRPLPYDTFMIDVEKETMGAGFEFFISSGDTIAGIKEEPGDAPATNWRIIYHDGFIQGYSSTNHGASWENKGGGNIDFSGKVYQGFKLTGADELVITNYKVYSSPFLIIQGFATGNLGRLTDVGGNVLERFFDEEYKSEIFLEKERTAKLEVISQGTNIFSSISIDFIPGDVYLYTSQNIQLIYHENILDYKITELQSPYERFTVKNAGDTDALGVKIKVVPLEIEAKIRFEEGQWESILYIEKLAPGESLDFFMDVENPEDMPVFNINYIDIFIY